MAVVPKQDRFYSIEDDYTPIKIEDDVEEQTPVVNYYNFNFIINSTDNINNINLDIEITISNGNSIVTTYTNSNYKIGTLINIYTTSVTGTYKMKLTKCNYQSSGISELQIYSQQEITWNTSISASSSKTFTWNVNPLYLIRFYVSKNISTTDWAKFIIEDNYDNIITLLSTNTSSSYNIYTYNTTYKDITFYISDTSEKYENIEISLECGNNENKIIVNPIEVEIDETIYRYTIGINECKYYSKIPQKFRLVKSSQELIDYIISNNILEISFDDDQWINLNDSSELFSYTISNGQIIIYTSSSELYIMCQYESDYNNYEYLIWNDENILNSTSIYPDGTVNSSATINFIKRKQVLNINFKEDNVTVFTKEIKLSLETLSENGVAKLDNNTYITFDYEYYFDIDEDDIPFGDMYIFSIEPETSIKNYFYNLDFHLSLLHNSSTSNDRLYTTLEIKNESLEGDHIFYEEISEFLILNKPIEINLEYKEIDPKDFIKVYKKTTDTEELVTNYDVSPQNVKYGDTITISYSKDNIKYNKAKLVLNNFEKIDNSDPDFEQNSIKIGTENLGIKYKVIKLNEGYYNGIKENPIPWYINIINLKYTLKDKNSNFSKDITKKYDISSITDISSVSKLKYIDDNGKDHQINNVFINTTDNIDGKDYSTTLNLFKEVYPPNMIVRGDNLSTVHLHKYIESEQIRFKSRTGISENSTAIYDRYPIEDNSGYYKIASYDYNSNNSYNTYTFYSDVQNNDSYKESDLILINNTSYTEGSKQYNLLTKKYHFISHDESFDFTNTLKDGGNSYTIVYGTDSYTLNNIKYSFKQDGESNEYIVGDSKKESYIPDLYIDNPNIRIDNNTIVIDHIEQTSSGVNKTFNFSYKNSNGISYNSDEKTVSFNIVVDPIIKINEDKFKKDVTNSKTTYKYVSFEKDDLSFNGFKEEKDNNFTLSYVYSKLKTNTNTVNISESENAGNPIKLEDSTIYKAPDRLSLSDDGANKIYYQIDDGSWDSYPRAGFLFDSQQNEFLGTYSNTSDISYTYKRVCIPQDEQISYIKVDDEDLYLPKNNNSPDIVYEDHIDRTTYIVSSNDLGLDLTYQDNNITITGRNISGIIRKGNHITDLSLVAKQTILEHLLYNIKFNGTDYTIDKPNNINTNNYNPEISITNIDYNIINNLKCIDETNFDILKDDTDTKIKFEDQSTQFKLNYNISDNIKQNIYYNYINRLKEEVGKNNITKLAEVSPVAYDSLTDSDKSNINYIKDYIYDKNNAGTLTDVTFSNLDTYQDFYNDNILNYLIVKQITNYHDDDYVIYNNIDSNTTVPFNSIISYFESGKDDIYNIYRNNYDKLLEDYSICRYIIDNGIYINRTNPLTDIKKYQVDLTTKTINSSDENISITSVDGTYTYANEILSKVFNDILDKILYDITGNSSRYYDENIYNIGTYNIEGLIVWEDNKNILNDYKSKISLYINHIYNKLYNNESPLFITDQNNDGNVEISESINLNDDDKFIIFIKILKILLQTNTNDLTSETILNNGYYLITGYDQNGNKIEILEGDGSEGEGEGNTNINYYILKSFYDNIYSNKNVISEILNIIPENKPTNLDILDKTDTFYIPLLKTLPGLEEFIENYIIDTTSASLNKYPILYYLNAIKDTLYNNGFTEIYFNNLINTFKDHCNSYLNNSQNYKNITLPETPDINYNPDNMNVFEYEYYIQNESGYKELYIKNRILNFILIGYSYNKFDTEQTEDLEDRYPQRYTTDKDLENIKDYVLRLLYDNRKDLDDKGFKSTFKDENLNTKYIDDLFNSSYTLNAEYYNKKNIYYFDGYNVLSSDYTIRYIIDSNKTLDFNYNTTTNSKIFKGILNLDSLESHDQYIHLYVCLFDKYFVKEIDITNNKIEYPYEVKNIKYTKVIYNDNSISITFNTLDWESDNSDLNTDTTVSKEIEYKYRIYNGNSISPSPIPLSNLSTSGILTISDLEDNQFYIIDYRIKINSGIAVRYSAYNHIVCFTDSDNSNWYHENFSGNLEIASDYNNFNVLLEESNSRNIRRYYLYNDKGFRLIRTVDGPKINNLNGFGFISDYPSYILSTTNSKYIISEE